MYQLTVSKRGRILLFKSSQNAQMSFSNRMQLRLILIITLEHCKIS